jgi:uncharacterized protein CbrC (UPF0167 family)
MNELVCECCGEELYEGDLYYTDEDTGAVLCRDCGRDAVLEKYAASLKRVDLDIDAERADFIIKDRRCMAWQ